MISAIAASLLAAAFPSDALSSVAIASYWHKKDERGRGDEISELAMPKRYPAFAISEDEFVLVDPLVRARHLDRIELDFCGDRVPAREIARTLAPDAVVLKADRPLKRVKPLAFRSGEPDSAIEWEWHNDTLVASESSTWDETPVTVVMSSGRSFREGEANKLHLDEEGNPVWLDLGARLELPDGEFKPTPPSDWKRLPADSYEKSAAAIEKRVADATLVLLVRLDPEDKDNRRHSRYDDESKNEIDALGYAVAGRVVVPSDLDGERISRMSKVEATFPDGSKTNLVFAGALAEWDAMVFDIPDGFKSKVSPLSIATGTADAFDNRIAWCVETENENGTVVVTAARSRFNGVDFIRGARFVPHVSDSAAEPGRGEPSFTLDEFGDVVVFSLSRRYTSDRWSSDNGEQVSAGDLFRFMAGECFNPEFTPREEEARNRFVWLGAETVRITEALARERKAQSFMKEYSCAPYVTEIYSSSPADKAGLMVGDILLAVRRGNEGECELEAEYEYSYNSSTPWPDVENRLNTLMSGFGVGAKITIVYARDGRRNETSVVLEPAPVHYKNAPKARNRALGLSVRDMTFEVRRFFKFDDNASGIVIAKVKPGSPADVAGLEEYELVTEVNGEKVTGAKDFAAKIKGKRDLVFSVRHLAQTRMVKIHVEPDAAGAKEKGK